MKAALLSLLLGGCIPWPAVAGPCTGAEAQLASISKELAQDAASAERLLVQVESSHPDCPELALVRARIQAAQGKPDEAESTFARYIEQAPDDSRGYAYLGRLLLDRGQYSRADPLSATAMEKNLSDPVALALRGQILNMKGEAQESLRLLEKSCQIDPDNAEAQFELGTIYDRAKRRAEAAEHFEKAATLNPRNPRAWDYLALNLEPLGKVDRADEAYRKGLDVNQAGPYFDAFLDYNYGRFLAKRNELAASKARFDHAVELLPQFRATWYERAKLNLQLKNYEEARTDAERAANIPDRKGIIIDLQIYALLEQVYQRLGDTERARKYAELSRQTPVPPRGEHR